MAKMYHGRAVSDVELETHAPALDSTAGPTRSRRGAGHDRATITTARAGDIAAISYELQIGLGKTLFQ
jgi:hypothetical protein